MKTKIRNKIDSASRLTNSERAMDRWRETNGRTYKETGREGSREREMELYLRASSHSCVQHALQMLTELTYKHTHTHTHRASALQGGAKGEGWGGGVLTGSRPDACWDCAPLYFQPSL